MAYLSLYRKYRPQTFADILGQEHVSTTLTRAIEEDRVAHAYLFTGPRGTGKTSTARILAKALNCVEGPTPTPCGRCESCVAISDGSSMDVIEMDAASHSKIDDTREVLAGVPLATAQGRVKVYVIDEVHMLSTGSFNALLKTLEEPPAHVVFILATTEAHKVLQTIVSRTQRFDFRRASVEILERHLASIARLEGIDIEAGALSVVARHAEGSFRDAISALDQLSSLAERITYDDAERMLGTRLGDALAEIFDGIARAEVGSVLQVLHGLVAQGADVRQIAMNVLDHARSLLLLKTAPSAAQLLDESEEERVRLTSQAESFTSGELVRMLDLVARAVTDMRTTPNHRLLLEIALVRAAAPGTDPSANGLLGRIERLERRIGIAGQQYASGPATPVESGAPEKGARVPESTETTVASAPGPASESAATSERDVDDSRPSPGQARPASVEPRAATPTPRQGESEPPPTPSTVAAAEHVGLGDFREAWPAALKEVARSSRRVGAYLTPSRPVRFDDQVLLVEVQAEYHQAQMSEERNREVLSRALHAVLGIRPQLAFAARGAPPPPAAEPDEVPEGDAARAVHDPVALIKQGLGAEVVEERVNEA